MLIYSIYHLTFFTNIVKYTTELFILVIHTGISFELVHASIVRFRVILLFFYFVSLSSPGVPDDLIKANKSKQNLSFLSLNGVSVKLAFMLFSLIQHFWVLTKALRLIVFLLEADPFSFKLQPHELYLCLDCFYFTKTTS